MVLVSPCLQTCSVYWPDSGTANFGPFDVEIVGKEDEVDVVTRVFKVHNNRRVGRFKTSESFTCDSRLNTREWYAA